MGCGLCKSKCPVDAIKKIEARDRDFVPRTSASIYG
jgi:ferredoxin